MATNKDRLALSVVRGLGLLSLVVLLLAKCPYSWVLESLCADDRPYGDMQVDGKLRQFKVRLPDPVGPELGQSAPGTTADHRLFIMGDSYLTDRRGHEPLPRRLSARLAEPIHFSSWRPSGPVCLFQGEAPAARAVGGRVFILERAERFLPDMTRIQPCPPPAPPAGGARSRAAKLFDVAFKDSEERLHYLLQNSLLTAPLIESWNSALYARFGILPALTPVVSRNPPFVFSKVETDPDLPTSFYAPHDDAFVAAVADGVARTGERLRSDYGVELVFMPIPNKYTIYYRDARPDDRYNDFLPRLYKELARRKVRFVDLYAPFMASSETVYYATDSHWNARGAEIAADALIRAVQDARGRASSTESRRSKE